MTDIVIRKAKASESDRMLADASGLYLLVRANGAKLWRFNYRFACKQKTLRASDAPAP